MSTWTYVRGTVLLHKNPYEVKDKDLIIPDPEHQMKLQEAEPVLENGEAKLRIGAEITSFPLIKEIVERNINILPNGEYDTINYFLNASTRSGCSTGVCFSAQEEAITNLIKKRYGTTWRTTFGRIDELDTAILTLFDGIRYCYAESFKQALINFMLKLVNEEKVMFGGGLLEFEDDSDFPGRYIVYFGDSIEIIKEQKDKPDEIEVWVQEVVKDGESYRTILKKQEEENKNAL